MNSKKLRENRGAMIGTVLAILAFLLIFFMPLPEGMTIEGKKV